MIKNEKTLNRLLKSGAIKGDLRPIVVAKVPENDPLVDAVKELTKEVRKIKIETPPAPEKDDAAEAVLPVLLGSIETMLGKLLLQAERMSKQTRTTKFKVTKRDATFRIEEVTATEEIING